MIKFITMHLSQIKRGGFVVLVRKLIWVAVYLIFGGPIIFALIIIRITKPLVLIRFGKFLGSRIGHFAANTELHLCEKDAAVNTPNCRHIDIYCISGSVCNIQLEKMWRRIIPNILPAWLIMPVIHINRIIPLGRVHEVSENSQHDRDVHNLYEKIGVHLYFTDEEEIKGREELLKMGIPVNAKFVCMTVRDGAYLKSWDPVNDYDYHNYRDCDVGNYKLAAEELANRGYYVIRMGVKVSQPLKAAHPNVIDYAANGMRTDFMDIYLGAKCLFCITNGTGFDAIPMIFRRPIVQVNAVPIGYAYTWGRKTILLFKHHFDKKTRQELSLNEIFESGAAYALSSGEFSMLDIELVENTPEEIKATVLEMVERLEGQWQVKMDDEMINNQFLSIYPFNKYDSSRGRRLHGRMNARYSAFYLRNNNWWLN